MVGASVDLKRILYMPFDRIPEFAVEHLPLGRTASLVTRFAVKDLPLGRTA